jgi:hypothetical protein
MRRFSGIVFLEALFEIGGRSDIALTWRRETFNKVDIKHWQPSFAKASEGILLRAESPANPAKRVSAKQDGPPPVARRAKGGGAGGIRTLDRALQPYNGLANRRLQPLGHSSVEPDMPDTGVGRKRQISGCLVPSHLVIPLRRGSRES